MKAFKIGQTLWTAFWKGDSTELGQYICTVTVLGRPYVVHSVYMKSDGSGMEEYFSDSYSDLTMYPERLIFDSQAEALEFSQTLKPRAEFEQEERADDYSQGHLAAMERGV